MVDVYKSTYSHVDVYESTINNIPLMRRCDDDWVNATQILKIAGLGKAQRTRVLEKEVHNYVHRKIQGGHGKFQGTWVPLEFAKGLALRHNIPIETLPVLYYDPETNDPLPDKPLAIKTKTTGNASAKNRASNSKAASSSSTLNKEKKRSLNLKSNSFPANGSKLTSPQKSKKDSNTTNTFGTNNPVSGLPPTFGMFHSATEPDFHKQNFTSPPDGSGSQQVQSHQLEAQRELHMLQKQQQQLQQHPIAGAPPTIGLADKIPPFYPSHQTNRSISSVPDVVSAQLREENDLNTHVSPSFYVMHETNVKRHQQNYLQPRYQQYTNLQYNQNNNTNREKLNYQQLAPQFQHSNSQPGHGVIHNREAFEAPNKILKHSRHHSSPHVVQQQPQSNYQIQQQHKQLQQQQQQQQQQQLQHQHQQLQQQHQQLQHQQHQQHQHQHQHQQHQQQQQQNLQYDSQENVSTQPFLDNQEYYTTQLLSFFINDSPVPEFLFNPPSDFDINRAIDDEGHTPLHWASALAAVDIIKLLVDHNADTLMLNDAGMNPLSKLIHFSNSYDWKNFHIILPLLKHCLVVPDANQRTPLHYLMEFSAVPNKVESSHYYFYEILKFIKHQQKEAERYYPDTNNNRQLLQVLINHVDINGDTALYLALKAQSHDFIVELLKNGADIEKVGIHNIPPEILKEVQLSGKITSLDNMNIGVNVDMNTNMDTRMNANISTNGNMNTNINTSMNMMNMSQNNHSNVQNGLQRKIQAASQHLNMTNAFLADSPSVLSPQDVHHSNLLSNNSDNSILKIDSTNDIIQQNNEEEKNPFLVSKYDTSPEIKNKGTPHTILVQRTPESQLCYPEDKENIFDSTLNEPLTSAKLALNSTSTPQKENRVVNEQSIADVTENRNTTFDEDTMIIKPSKISITEVDNFVKKLPEMVSYLKRSLENKTDHLSYNVETINKLNLEISSLSMKNSKFLKKISKVAKSDKDIDYLKIANSPSSIIDNFTSSNISRINTTLVNKSDKLLDLYERSQALEVAKLVNNEEVTIREEPAESYQNKLELAIHLTLLQIKRRKIVEQTLELYLNDGVDDDDFYFDEDAIDDNMSSEDADDFRMMRSKISVYKKLISSICGLPEKEINSDLLNEIENVLS